MESTGFRFGSGGFDLVFPFRLLQVGLAFRFLRLRGASGCAARRGRAPESVLPFGCPITFLQLSLFAVATWASCFAPCLASGLELKTSTTLASFP